MPKHPTSRPRLILFDKSNDGNVSGKIICIGKQGIVLHTEIFNCYIGHKNQRVEPRGIDFSEAQKNIKRLSWTLQTENPQSMSNIVKPADISPDTSLSVPEIEYESNSFKHNLVTSNISENSFETDIISQQDGSTDTFPAQYQDFSANDNLSLDSNQFLYDEFPMEFKESEEINFGSFSNSQLFYL